MKAGKGNMAKARLHDRKISLHALPFFKIDRESLCIQGSKYNIGEAIFEYISQEGRHIYTDDVRKR